MEFLWGVLAIAVAIGVYLAYRKGISQGFKFAKNHFDKLIEPREKIAFLNGRDETLEAYRDDVHMFRMELKLKRSGKVIDNMTDEQMKKLEHLRELAKKEAAETRRKMEEHMRGMAQAQQGGSFNPWQELLDLFMGRR